MNELIVLTGANGHLGRAICKELTDMYKTVRGLVLPGESADALKEMGAKVVFGDVTKRESLEPLFAGADGQKLIVIHAAAIIEIISNVSPQMRSVNVDGTKNVVEAALGHGVEKFIHVSSVHAIPEKKGIARIFETKKFSPETVEGGYAKSKAEASALVMESVRKSGLPAVILHPTGILGPGDRGNNHLVAVIKAYMEKRLPASVRAGYNLVDVRDVAVAVVSALDNARIGETYILSGHHCEVPNILKAVSVITGNGPRHCPAVPTWLAKLAAGVIERAALRKKQRPLFTKYAVETLTSNDNFSCAKASKELGFNPRNIFETLEDTISWLEQHDPDIGCQGDG